MNVEVSLFLFLFELLAKIAHIASTLTSSITQIVIQLVAVHPRIVETISKIRILLFLQP